MRRKYLLLCILIDILAISLIPVNALLINFNMPEFLSILASLTVIASAAIFFIKIPKGKISKAFVGILAFITVVISILGSYCNPYWNSIQFRLNADYYSKPYDYRISSGKAVEDLDYAMKYLKKLHPALYREIPEDIRQQYEKVKTRIQQSGEIRVNDLAREIESVFSILRDGNTYLRGNYADRKIMKYYRRWISDGYEITAVNGISIEELLDRMSNYYSFEATSWELEWLSDDIVTEAGLDYLGFDMEDGIEYTLTSSDRRTRVETCNADDFLSWKEYAEFNGIDNTKTTEKSFVSYEIDEEKNIAILRLDQCTYNSEYINCVRAMFQEVKDKGIGNVAVDLRYNGGGNSQVANEFFRYLDIDSYKIGTLGWRFGFIYIRLGNGIAKNDKYEDLLFNGNLYLLTSAGTFSSAMMFAQLVKDNNLGTIIGEAPGNDPNGYGEIAYFKLPNSQLFMQISTKRFYRADRECTDDLVYPDIECKSELVMDELYKLINKK